MELSTCYLDDIPMLAQLNKKLFEDEKNDNIPTFDMLEEQLKNAMNSGSKAYFFKEDGDIIGYALVKTHCSPYYLSHFFISKDKRRNHFGTTAFYRLLDELKTDTLDLDVFVWNHRGQEFWKSLGFKDRCIIMRRS